MLALRKPVGLDNLPFSNVPRSYTHALKRDAIIWTSALLHAKLVGLDGLEPSTSRLSGARSSHLSYKPEFNS